MSSSGSSFVLFTLSGLIGTGLFYVVYEAMQSAFSQEMNKPVSPLYPYREYSAALSWTLSYAMSIVWQHALHRYLVFGPVAAYWKSLFHTYISYTLGLVLSSLFSTLFTVYLHIPHQISFGLTLGVTGVINYFTVSEAMGGDKKEKGKSGKEKSSKGN